MMHVETHHESRFDYNLWIRGGGQRPPLPRFVGGSGRGHEAHPSRSVTEENVNTAYTINDFTRAC